jgi:hypothetical protein
MEYLASLSDECGISRLYTHLSAISYFHRRSGKISPCDEPIVKMFMKGLKRSDSLKPIKRAKPLTVDILCKLVDLLDHDRYLITWRTVWRSVIGFSCFLRWDDISRLKVFPFIFLLHNRFYKPIFDFYCSSSHFGAQ